MEYPIIDTVKVCHEYVGNEKLKFTMWLAVPRVAASARTTTGQHYFSARPPITNSYATLYRY